MDRYSRGEKLFLPLTACLFFFHVLLAGEIDYHVLLYPGFTLGWLVGWRMLYAGRDGHEPISQNKLTTLYCLSNQRECTKQS